MDNLDRFGSALDKFEKAKAKRDYASACEHLVEAIDNNPYPSLYDYLAGCLVVTRGAYMVEVEAARPKGFFERFHRALFSPLGKQERQERFGYMA